MIVGRASRVQEREALMGVGREVEKLVVNRTIGYSLLEAPFRGRSGACGGKPKLLLC